MNNTYKVNDDCQIKDLNEILIQHIGYRTDGLFCEIGAFDGQTVSNTCFLADIGWRGVYIEPIPEHYIRCLFRHCRNNVKVINASISGTFNGMINMSVGAMITTARFDHVEIFNANDWSKGHHSDDIRKVPCLSVSLLLEKFIGNSPVDIVVIDVEGMEPEIIENWNFDLCKPKLFIIESRDRDPEFPNSIQTEYKNMLKFLIKNNYELLHHDGCNVILKSS